MFRGAAHAACQGNRTEPVYYVLGETDAGRALFCVIIEFPGGRGYPVTARDMTTKERRRYAAWKRR